MYPIVLFLHSWVRWIVLILAVVAIARAIGGWIGKRPYGPADDRVGKLFTAALDLQFLLGILLYFVFSPLTRAALRDFGGAMGDSTLRFWGVEHAFGMLIAVILIHRGRTRVKGVADPITKHKVAAIFFILGLVAMAASIPWPATPQGRPLFRW